jgi:hypothetical protein
MIQKSNDMNAGNWIVVTFVLFATFIGGLVTVCVRQDVNLVSKDYYKEELAYQDQVTRINNTNSLSQKPTVNVIEADVIEVKFDSITSITKGTLKLFCPSDPTMDREFNLLPLADYKRKVEIRSLKKGMYRARIYWENEEQKFYYEATINI